MNHLSPSFAIAEALKRELKQWEHEFINLNKRSPTKDDIRDNPAIKHKYKEYSSIKRKLSLGTKTSNHKTPKTPTHRDGSDTRANPVRESANDSAVKTFPTEIGPTPQIFGKSMSIFELSLSPVKKRLELPTPDVSSEFESTIQAVSSPPPEIVISSVSGPDEDLSFEESKETTSVGSLGVSKAADRLLTTKKTYGPNSPLRMPTSISIKTPIKLDMESADLNDEASNFETPPIWRGSLSKPLRDLEEEFITVSMNFNPFEEDAEMVGLDHSIGLSETAEMEDKGNSNEHKSKRRKNRVRVRRPSDINSSSALDLGNLDLHSQLKNLKRVQLQIFAGETGELQGTDMGNAVPDALSEPKRETVNGEGKKDRAKRPKKYNLVSNNFRRLKLPKRKANGKAKYFMGRRR